MKSVCNQMYKFAIDLEIVSTSYASLAELPSKEKRPRRHTCATLMDNADIPLKIKQLILGHSSNETALRNLKEEVKSHE